MAAQCGVAPYDGELGDVAPGAPPASEASAFGMQLASATGLAAGVWPAGEVRPIAAATRACVTASAGAGQCAFRFGAVANATDGPGPYSASVDMLVLPRL